MKKNLLLLSLLFNLVIGKAQNMPGSGNTLSFNGFSTYVNCGNNNRTLTNQVTVEAWIKTSSSAYQWIAGKYLNSTSEEKGFHLFTSGGLAFLNGRINQGIYVSSGASITRVDDGRWHHIAGSTDGTTWRIYVDGVLENTTVNAYGPADLTTTVPLTIGNYYAQNQQNFQGDIDEVRVWRTARSAADIQATMCRKFAAVPADLVAYYRLDQSSGLVAPDAGSQPTPGSLVGFAGAAPWRLSGAPLGDVSASLYPTGSVLGRRVGLLSAAGDSAVAGLGLGIGVRGVQLYSVSSAPSISAGPGAANEYFGVFTSGSGSTPLTYTLRLRPAGGASCRTAQQRPANDQSWATLLTTPVAAIGSLTASSLVYRGEYILLGTAPPPITLSGDTAVCAGATGQLTAAAAGATGYSWNTGPTTPTLSGLSPGTYTVTVSFSTGCSATAQRVIRRARPPGLVVGGDSLLCPAGAARLTASATAGATFRWSTGATTAGISVAAGGTYSVISTTPAGCIQQASYRVRAVGPPPSLTLGADTTLCEGDQLVLRAPAGRGLSYQWSDGSTGPQLLVQAAGSYSLRVSTGCASVQASRVIAARTCLVVPNIITPNADARNDLLVIEGLRGPDWSLDIYNRWGAAVLHTSSYRNDWGATAAPGLYYLLLRRASTGFSYKGWVEVLR